MIGRSLFLLPFATILLAAEPPTIRVDTPRPAPEWALLERQLIDQLNQAGEIFVETYANPDGTLRWQGALRGRHELLRRRLRGVSRLLAALRARRLEKARRRFIATCGTASPRQFTRYGQVYREFDSNWDWMHHGEGYVSFYPLGLADPYDREVPGALQSDFAAMYTGADPEAAKLRP